MKKTISLSRRALSVLLVLVMCLGMFQMTAFASEGEQHEVADKPTGEAADVDTVVDDGAGQEETIEPTPSALVDGDDEEQSTGVNKPAAGETKEDLTHKHEWIGKPYGCDDSKCFVYSCNSPGCTESYTTDHTWDNGKITKDPTATENGVKTFTCSVCNKNKTEDIPATGNTEKPEHEHKMIGKPYGCDDSKCYIYSCEIEGCDYSYTVDHNFVGFFSTGNGDTDTHYRKCSICGKVVEEEQHIWSDWKEVNPASEKNDGLESRSCKKCEAQQDRLIPAKEHKHTLEYCDGTPATCTETGMEGSWYCTVPGCDAHFSDENGTQSVSKDDLTIPTLEPVFEGADWIEQDELKHYRPCVNCDGKADGHTEFGAHVKFSEWKTVKEATENEAGEEQRKCLDCGYTQTREIPINSGETEPPVEEKTITVTWLSGYGNNEAITTITINQGDNYSSQTPSNPTRSGYTFTDWGTPVVDPDTGNITITAQWTQNNNGGDSGIIFVPTPTPTPDDPNDPVDIPDNPVPGGGEPEDPNEPDDPGIEIPDEPVPGGGEPDTPDNPNTPDDPIVDITDPDVPTADRPVISNRPTRPVTPTRPTDSSELTEIVDEEVPLADTPETGDNVWVWYLTALLSAAGIAVLAVLENKKRAKH